MSDDDLSRTFAALSAPIRRFILEELAKGPVTASALTLRLKPTFAGVSKHIGVLEGAGLVYRTTEGRYRPLHLDTRPLHGASVWLERGELYDRSFDALQRYLDAPRRIAQDPTQKEGPS